MKLSKSYLYSIIICCGGLLSGWFFQMSQENSQAMSYENFNNFLNAFVTIFTHNIVLILVMFVISIVPYICIVPVLFANFFIFGASVYLSMENVGIVNTFLRYIHAIVEIPAILISFSIALRISCSIYLKLTGGQSKVGYKKRELLFIVVLLVVGALVEALYFR